MSDASDIKAKLKEHGFTLHECGSKHLRYSNGRWMVSIPKSWRMSPSLVRGILRQLEKPAIRQRNPNGRSEP